RRVAFPEGGDDLLPLAGAPVQVTVTDAGCAGSLRGGGKETGELAEHEHPVTVGDDLVEHLHQRVELGGGDLPAARVDERHIQGGLSQHGERTQYLEAVPVHVPEQPEDLLAFSLKVG